MPIEIICLNCEKTFKVQPKRRDTAKFCSIQCKHNFHRTELECFYCGKLFQRAYGIIKARKSVNVFCSRKCQEEYTRQKGPWNKGINLLEVTCDWCGCKIVKPKSLLEQAINHFCSRECSAKWVSKYEQGKNNRNWKSEEVQCTYCNGSFLLPPSKIALYHNHFCNRECKGKWMSENLSGENNPNWLGGHVHDRGENWQIQRVKALERDGYVCQNCGSIEDLDVHHIVPYRYFDDYMEANEVDNLITLCHSCHMGVENHFTKEICLVLIVGQEDDR